MTRYFVTIRSETVPVDVDSGEVRVDGRSWTVDLAGMEGAEVRTLLLGGVSYRVVARRDGGRWALDLGAGRELAEVADERALAIREMTGQCDSRGGASRVTAPMPGLVVKVEVGEGDEVEAGRGLVIIEAMKMENELRAESAGRVERVHVTDGQAVEKGQLLVELAPPTVD